MDLFNLFGQKPYNQFVVYGTFCLSVVSQFRLLRSATDYRKDHRQFLAANGGLDRWINKAALQVVFSALCFIEFPGIPSSDWQKYPAIFVITDGLLHLFSMSYQVLRDHETWPYLDFVAKTGKLLYVLAQIALFAGATYLCDCWRNQFEASPVIEGL